MSEPIGIYAHILAYSLKQPPWKQDLLRRIVVHGPLQPADLDAGVLMCKAHHELPCDAALEPKLLEASDLPVTATSTSEPVCLVALKNLEGVNALLPGQTLSFAKDGLTSVFGYNGTGKSGYARVLKKLCRARGAIEPILPNVFSPASGQPKATVEYRVGAEPLSWTGALGTVNVPGPDALGQVGIYDQASGASFLAKDQAVEFLPQGLDVLHSLREALEHIAKSLEKEQSSDARSASLPALPTDTPAGQFLAGLSRATTNEQLDTASAWTTEDDDTLTQVSAELARLAASDPQKQAKVLQAKAARVERLSKALNDAHRKLSDAVANRVVEVCTAKTVAEQAQALQASTSIAQDGLPGTGGEPWRLLWAAARRFSVEAAYPKIEFPNVDADARCVLCQQDLDEHSKTRLQQFDAYVKDEVAKQLAEANTAHSKGIAHLQGAIDPALISGDLRGDEQSIDEALVAQLDDFIGLACARRDALLSVLEHGSPHEALPEFAPPPVVMLDAQARGDRDAATKLLATSAAEATRTAKRQKSELEARKQLHQCRAALDEEVTRLGRAFKRSEAKKDCVTTSVSSLVGKLTEELVTGALVEAFNRELADLGGGHLSVELKKGATRAGVPHTHLMLRDSAQGKQSVALIFSEGERRAIALASFFAELDISPSRSAIVFDDPVTSMDHRWREKVANRLAREAKQRQVIVFTHDAVFIGHRSDPASSAGQLLQFGARVRAPLGAWWTTGLSRRHLGGVSRDQAAAAKASPGGNPSSDSQSSTFTPVTAS